MDIKETALSRSRTHAKDTREAWNVAAPVVATAK